MTTGQPTSGETNTPWLESAPVQDVVASLATWLEFELLLGARGVELRGALTPETCWTWTLGASAPTRQATKLYAIEADALARQVVAVADRELVDQEAEVRGLDASGGPHRPGKQPYRLHDDRREVLGEVLRMIGDPTTVGEDCERLELLTQLLDVLANEERLAKLADSLTASEAEAFRARY